MAGAAGEQCDASGAVRARLRWPACVCVVHEVEVAAAVSGLLDAEDADGMDNEPPVKDDVLEGLATSSWATAWWRSNAPVSMARARHRRGRGTGCMW